jgi:hypothetical protein
MLENTFRFAPFPGHVGNQPLEGARKPRIQLMIVHLMNAGRFWKHMTKVEMGAEILSKR